jgi:hypothetical protein
MARTERLMDRSIAALAASLDRASESDVQRWMPFPTVWNPCAGGMTSRDGYQYRTQHDDHHRRQLTLDRVQQQAAT